MDFNDLSNADKIAMLNLTATLMDQNFITFRCNDFKKEEILDFLVVETEALMKDSALLKLKKS